MVHHPLPASCGNVLFTEDQIRQRVAQLGMQISKDYEDVLKPGEDLILVGILTGAYMFAADLSREITVPTRNEFMSVSSYNDGVTSSGEVRIIMDCRNSIRTKHILVIEDIVDSGHTLDFLVRMLEIRRPASIRTCVLLQAPKRKRQIECKVDYLGFDIGDKFVVGYGLDLGGRFRNLPYIAELSTEVMNQLLGSGDNRDGNDDGDDDEGDGQNYNKRG